MADIVELRKLEDSEVETTVDNKVVNKVGYELHFQFEVNKDQQLFVQNVHFEEDKAKAQAQEYVDNYEKEFLANREEQAKKDAEETTE